MRWFVVVLVLLGGLLLGAFMGWQHMISPVNPEAVEQEFEIEPGWTGIRVAQALADEGFVRSQAVVQLYFRLEQLDQGFGEGLYDISASQSLPEIMTLLQQPGRPREVTLTFPEGWRITEILDRLAASTHWTAEELEAARDTSANWVPEWFPVTLTGVEGYLFPDTYRIPQNYTAPETLSVFINRFEQELTPELHTAINREGLTLHEWVVLASIVQAEAANDDEMPIITGVFLNRMDLGMPLQSDPTAVYESGKPLAELTAADLRIPSPWNTYTEPGLPRGPISNPGSAALNAILDPVREDSAGREYLYFLHGFDDGEPVFRPNTSLAAHNRDIDRFLR